MEEAFCAAMMAEDCENTGFSVYKNNLGEDV